MKTEFIYIADDGSRFDSQSKCGEYETLLWQVRRAMSRLAPRPEGDRCRFVNGHGFIRHSKEQVMEAYGAILEIAKNFKVIPSDLATRTSEGFYPGSIVGRYLDDSGNHALYGAWTRFMCMDDQWREWGQPYFVKHPHHAESQEEVAA